MNPKDKKPKQTSWGSVAEWYDDVLQDPDSYQKNVLMPNIIRIVDPKKGMTILDNACGQGYFSRAFAGNGADVIAADISKELIGLAQAQEARIQKEKIGKGDIQNGKIEKFKDSTKSKSNEAMKGKMDKEGKDQFASKSTVANFNSSSRGNIAFHVASADALPFIANESIDVITVVLALQNIENLHGTFLECSRVLKSGGRMVFVINHPAFRIPQSSDWGWLPGEGKQYRRIDSYMSDQTFKIDMTPGEKNIAKKKITLSFHRPLQSYFKVMNKTGFTVARLEEWISHKKSQEGPRAAEEDRMRKEIPMFLMIEARKG